VSRSDRDAPSTGHDWDRIDELFERAQQRTGAARARYLNEACDDPSIRAEVESLLEHVSPAEDLFEQLSESIASSQLRSRVPPADEDPLVGGRVGPYLIEARVGRGAVAGVYRARDERDGRRVALKVLEDDIATDVASRDRFLVETRAAQAAAHPNICSIHESGEVDGWLFLAMEYYEGETLKERLVRGGLPVHEALECVRQVALGLAEAHRHGIVHRDVKPSNILLTSEGTPKILDFGVAKMAGAAVTRTGLTLGTLAYMAPEQIMEGRVSAASDVWSLAVVLCEALTGEHPFARSSQARTLRAIVLEDPLPLGPVGDRLLPKAARALDAALSKTPDERPSPSDLAQALALPGESTSPTTQGSDSGSRGVDRERERGWWTRLVRWGRNRP
jgi:serine/threonine protein kinase